jgi:hypothetical protein
MTPRKLADVSSGSVTPVHATRAAAKAGSDRSAEFTAVPRAT